MAGLTVTNIALCIIGCSFGATLPKEIIGIETNMEYLGRYDTKLYFTRRTSGVLASDAKEMCELEDMELVQFENSDELEGVSSFLSQSNRIYYWTSAITTTRYVWEVDADELIDESLDVQSVTGPVPSCVVVSRGVLSQLSCFYVSTTYSVYPLCQVHVENLISASFDN